MNRRHALALLLVCAVGTTAAVPAAATSSVPGQQIPGSKIAHVIVMIQENRTVDNLFSSSFLTNGAGYPGADTTRTALLHTGKTAPLHEEPFEVPYTPLHMHRDLVREWNGGRDESVRHRPRGGDADGVHAAPDAGARVRP